MNSSYIPALDGTRALAVLLVMLFHFHHYPFGAFGLGVGWVGVQLFFVLSGFLITRILIHEKQKPLGAYLKRFYWRRTLRIFPVYFAYLLGVAALFLLTGEPEPFGKYALSLFTYTYNFSRLFTDWQHSPMLTHLWSLCVEEQFYLIWPFVVYFSSQQSLKQIVVALWVLCPVLRWLLADYLQTYLPDDAAGEAVYWFTFSHFDAFATGAAIHLFGWQQSTQAGSCLIGTLSLLLAAGLCNDYLTATNADLTSLGFPIGGLANLQHVWSYTLLNFAFAAFLAWLMQRQGRTLFAHPLLVRVGQVSYGIYLFHWAILGIFAKVLAGFSTGVIASAAMFTAYTILVYVAAWLSFRYFESWFLRFKGH
ncbi:acyltransferase family protein [Rhodoflexus sp.]